jgi:5-methylcytosine-specific restriction protein A
MQVGDVALFTGRRIGFYTGTVIAKLHNPRFAERLWEHDGEDRTWEYMYGVGQGRFVSIPDTELNEAIGYKSNYAVRGYSVLTAERSSRAIELVAAAPSAEPPQWIHLTAEVGEAESAEEIVAVLLTWNPDLWEPGESEFRSMLEGSIESAPVTERWSTGSRTHIPNGTAAFLVRQSRDRGIVAAGVTLDDVYEDEHWNGTAGAVTNYVDIQWDSVLPIADRLTVEALRTVLPLVPWDHLQGSGVMPGPEHFADEVPHDASRLIGEWNLHLSALGLARPDLSEEIHGTSGGFLEGAATTVTVNRYERSRSARRKCLEHWGFECSVCDHSMEEMYGPDGFEQIHVHHLTPMSQVRVEYRIDPIADLRPVCPNCHAAIHFGGEHRTIDQARAMYRRIT